MDLLIDTNVLVDVLQKRYPYYEYSSLIWKLCETGKARGYVSALSIANIIYVMKKHISKERIEPVLSMLFQIFHVASLTSDDLSKAASLHWDDYEDAVQFSTAEKTGSCFIITRNKKDFSETEKLKVMTPEEFIWCMRSFDIRRYLNS